MTTQKLLVSLQPYLVKNSYTCRFDFPFVTYTVLQINHRRLERIAIRCNTCFAVFVMHKFGILISLKSLFFYFSSSKTSEFDVCRIGTFQIKGFNELTTTSRFVPCVEFGKKLFNFGFAIVITSVILALLFLHLRKIIVIAEEHIELQPIKSGSNCGNLDLHVRSQIKLDRTIGKNNSSIDKTNKQIILTCHLIN